MYLVDRLVTIQKDNGWYDGRMATELGVERSTWVRIRNGVRQPGQKVLQGVLRRFPELKEDVSLFLSSGGSEVTESDRIVPEAHQDDRGGRHSFRETVRGWWQSMRGR